MYCHFLMLTAALHSSLLQLALLPSATRLCLSTFSPFRGRYHTLSCPEPCQEPVLILSSSLQAARGGISVGTTLDLLGALVPPEPASLWVETGRERGPEQRSCSKCSLNKIQFKSQVFRTALQNTQKNIFFFFKLKVKSPFIFKILPFIQRKTSDQGKIYLKKKKTNIVTPIVQRKAIRSFN